MTIKIIWDFRGEDGEQIAKHHAIHLNEFCQKEAIPTQEIGFASLSDFHSIAFIITNKVNVTIIRDALKPHRAEIVDNL